MQDYLNEYRNDQIKADLSNICTKKEYKKFRI